VVFIFNDLLNHSSFATSASNWCDMFLYWIYSCNRYWKMQVMTKTHYYLVDTSVIIPGAKVSDLQFKIISEEPFFVHGLKVSTIISFNIFKWGILVLCPCSSFFLSIAQPINFWLVPCCGRGLALFFFPSIIVLQFTPLPVWHGQNYRSLGFRFGNICYIR